jgi:hypothetical protein
MAVNGGGVPLMLNAAELLVPFVPLTVMLTVPGAAFAEIEKVAVIWFEPTTFTFETVMPGVLALTAVPEAKLKPLMVTPTAVPTPLLLGVIPVMYGVDERTVADPLTGSPE